MESEKSEIKLNSKMDDTIISKERLWKYKKYFLIYVILFLFIQIPLLSLHLPSESEGWFSDIAYNLNREFTGNMAKDIPWGDSWSTGIGKLFFLLHHIVYKVFGVGLLQARLVTLIGGALLLYLVFRWARKNISSEIALLSTVLLMVSFSFWPFLPNARQDVIFCLFSFFSFYLLSSALTSKKDLFFVLAGFIAALSVDITYRGIEIVMCTFLVHFIYFDKKTFIKHSALLLFGSSLAFIIWFSINILPMGFSNFFQHNLAFAADTQSSTIKAFLSEIYRFFEFTTIVRNLAKIEVVYWIILLIIFYRYRLRLKYLRPFKFIITWLLSCFVSMSFIEPQTFPAYFLMYSPFICMLCGISLYELFNRKKKFAYGMLFFILLSGMGYQVGRFTIYSYFYLKNDLNINGYFEKLRSSVDVNKSILGNTHYWYAFPDAQYYGGNFYLSRVISVLKELKPAEEYDNSYNRAKALLKVFEKRNIKYIISDENLRPSIVTYFPNNEYPKNNFLLVNTIKDVFLGKGKESKKPPYTTEIYKVISYEP